jgi:hypothetical protein
MEPKCNVRWFDVIALLACVATASATVAASEPVARDSNAPGAASTLGVPAKSGSQSQEQSWNLHLQNTDIVQADRRFFAK